MKYYYTFFFFSFTVATVLILCYQDVRLNNPSVLHVNYGFCYLAVKIFAITKSKQFLNIYYSDPFKFFHLKSFQGGTVRSIDLCLHILGLGVFDLAFLGSLSFWEFV